MAREWPSSLLGTGINNRGNSVELEEEILKYSEILKEMYGDISSQERNITLRLKYTLHSSPT